MTYVGGSFTAQRPQYCHCRLLVDTIPRCLAIREARYDGPLRSARRENYSTLDIRDTVCLYEEAIMFIL